MQLSILRKLRAIFVIVTIIALQKTSHGTNRKSDLIPDLNHSPPKDVSDTEFNSKISKTIEHSLSHKIIVSDPSEVKRSSPQQNKEQLLPKKHKQSKEGRRFNKKREKLSLAERITTLKDTQSRYKRRRAEVCI